MASHRLDPYEENAKRTPEERRENAAKAGVASGVVRRNKRLMRDVLSQHMTDAVRADDLVKALRDAGCDPGEATYETAIAMAALLRASRGDIEAARFVRDTLGEKPTEAFNIGVTGKPIRALDLSSLTDQELESLADTAEG